MTTQDTTPVFLFNDIETGGLNGILANGELGMSYYPIFELAFIVTNKELEELGEPLEIAVYQNEEEIAKSHEWALNTHTQSGVIERTRQSKVTVEQAEKMIIQYLQSFGAPKFNRKTKEGLILAGNSIMFDRCYILAQMKELHEYLHYKQLDISGIALACRYWRPEIEEHAISQKQYKHEALADIRESITELKTYKKALFNPQGQ